MNKSIFVFLAVVACNKVPELTREPSHTYTVSTNVSGLRMGWMTVPEFPAHTSALVFAKRNKKQTLHFGPTNQ